MEIVLYSDQYREDVHRLVREFHAESLGHYVVDFDLDTLQAMMNDLIACGITGNYPCCYLAVENGLAQGLIAGKEVKTPWSKTRIWHEFVWFMSAPYRRYGIKLLNVAKERLKQCGFESMVIAHMHNSKAEQLTKLYERSGFVPMESHYIGRL
jgi:hypothetical protein